MIKMLIKPDFAKKLCKHKISTDLVEEISSKNLWIMWIN